MPNDRLLSVEESLRPPPKMIGAIISKVFTDIS
jgi:hypothetical protein